jgi:hypothetical protein
MHARQFGTAAIVAAVGATALAGAAWACGDKLVALGGGVGFERVMVSRNPGHIVLLLEPATGLSAANTRFNLAGSLSLAGHEVFIVKDAEELRAQRDTIAPDLILVDAERAQQLQFQPVAGGTGPVIMPVAYSADRGEMSASEQQAGCVAVASGRKGAQVLKAVENALKLRSRGQAQPCDPGANSQKV